MPTLFDKIYGIEAATTIANSMGDVVEGMSWDRIEAEYGLLTELLPQHGKSSTWGTRLPNGDARMEQEWGYPFIWHLHDRPPGQSEDGHERYRLAVTAIIEKKGRITIDDLARVWIRDVDPNNFGYLLGPQDQVIYHSLKAGVFPWEVGRYATFPGMIGTSKMMIAVGVINACAPDQAARDAHDLARIKDVRGPRDNYSFDVAAAIAAGTAESLRPHATVDDVIGVALSHLGRVPRAEVEEGLAWARQASDWKELRPLYQARYQGHWMSNAVEILSSAMAIFSLCEGHVEPAIVNSVNMGRDTDCRAYIAGGWSAGLRGIEEVPARWLDTVTEQVIADKYTVSKRTPFESARGLYEALIASVQDSRERIHDLGLHEPPNTST